nr:MAG TPA: hypothetical protein [Caudoviricetes sp.]
MNTSGLTQIINQLNHQKSPQIPTLFQHFSALFA